MLTRTANSEVAREFGALWLARVNKRTPGGGLSGRVYRDTASSVHLDQVTQTAKAGKHILCEKPLGMTVEECEQMIQVCKENGVKLGTGFMMRFHAYHQEALKTCT